ncbi:MAG TPA: hypothetical protein VNZ56_02710 [Verrucomicrobiae bacterium]|jgi:hypothetical protein|nr:hypothetical protein [Verrucomicrobiae bacterium]
MGVINPMLQHDESEWSTDKSTPIDRGRRGHSKMLWALVLILGAALGGLAYYGYRMAKTQDVQIAQLFGSQGTLTTLGQRADAVENKLQGLAGDWQGMAQRMTKLEGRVTADAQQTRKYAETLTQQLHQQITAEIDARTSPLDARLRQMESEEANQRAQVAQLQANDANLKQEIAGVRDDNGRAISGMRAQEEDNARDVGALSQKLDRQRIDFEMAKGESKELAPGVDLRIRGMNPAYQRYHGSIFLLQDHRTVWLKDQSVNEPVRIFHKDGGEPYELVVTDVTKKAVAGYLLAPVKPETAAASAALTGRQAAGVTSVTQ